MLRSRIWAKMTFQKVPAETIPFKSFEKETNFLMVYAVLYVAFGYAIGLIIQTFPLPILGATKFNQDIWYSGVFKIFGLLLLPSWIFFKKWGYAVKDILFGWKPTFRNVLWLIAFYTIGFFVNASHLGGIKEAMPQFPDATFRLAVGVIMPLLTAGIPEELFYRCFFQTRLEKKWNRIIAILVATLLFTAWHLPSRFLLSTGVEGEAGDFLSVILGTGLPVFIAGLFFAFHWDRYRNLPVLMALHWGIDTLPSLSSYFRIVEIMQYR